MSLWFGRNEENGLRCPYHGWKYDVTGQCIEVPSEPAESGFCQKIKLKSYPLRRAGRRDLDLYGAAGDQPPLPDFEWAKVPASHRFISKRHAGMQLPAGDGRRHRFRPRLVPAPPRPATAIRSTQHQGAEHHPRHQKPNFEIVETPGGLLIGARRNAEAGHYYWRITQWIMPWYTMIPPYGDNALNGHAWVPIDDENCMCLVLHLSSRRGRSSDTS